MKKLNKGTWKWIAVAVVGVGLTAALIGVGARVSDLETTKKLSSSSFGVGQYANEAILDENDKTIVKAGELLPSSVEGYKNGLYTKAYYKYEGLDVELDKDATVTYEVNYYNANKEYIGTLAFNADYDVADEATKATADGVDVSSAKYVKIEVIPKDDEDQEVSWFEKSGYLSDVTVTVAK